MYRPSHKIDLPFIKAKKLHNIEYYKPWYKPTTLRWVPVSNSNLYPKEDDSDENLFETIRGMYGSMTVLLGMLELSIPPYLAPKYHCMRVDPLIRSMGTNVDSILGFSYARVPIWYSLFCQTFGLQYLNHIHKQFENLNKIMPSKAISQNRHVQTKFEKVINPLLVQREEIFKCVGQLSKVDSAPQQKDCAKRSMDFLLEPSVLIQLAWNTVLLHQWLVAALTEVLTFEKYTLELRHWPVVEQVEPVARQLLVLVRDLKNRILLGLMIMRQQVMDYPKVDPRHPAWILDEVVLPSLASLQFINPVTGNAHEIVKSIKILSWAKAEDLPAVKTNRLYISAFAYKCHSQLEEYFQQSFHASNIWCCLQLGPYMLESKILNLEELINTKIRMPNDIKPSKNLEDNRFKLQTFNETASYVHISNFCMSSDEFKDVNTPDKRLNFTLDFINKHIFNKGRLPKESTKFVEALLCINREPEDEEVFNLKNLAGVTTAHALIYKHLSSELHEYEKEQGVLPYLILLGVSNDVREQILRVTNTLGLMTNQTPIDINVKKYKAPAMEVSAMLKCLKDVQENKKDRNWLWSQFPDQWRAPVNLREPEMKLPLGDENMVQKLEDRIGRIIVNAAEKSFKIYEQGGEMFPHWTTVQYIMPSLIGMFIQNFFLQIKDNFRSNFLMLVQKILHYFEKSYIDWEMNPGKNSNSKLDDKVFVEILECYDELNCTLRDCNLILSTHIDHEYTFQLHSNLFDTFRTPMLEWYIELKPMGEASSSEFVCRLLKNWICKSVTIMQIINQAAIEAWNFPHPQKLALYQEYFTASEAISILERLYFKMNITLNENELLGSDINKLVVKFKDEAFDPLYEWRYELYKILSPQSNSTSKSSTSEILKTGKSLLSLTYQGLKKYRLKYSRYNLNYINLKFVTIMSPTQKLVCDSYLSNSFESLDAIFFRKPSSTQSKGKLQAKPSTSTENIEKLKISGENDKITEEVTKNKCRMCDAIEGKNKFWVCKKCIDDDYPDIHYFCSKKCEKLWWKQEHMAEHLEFELGLGKYPNLYKSK